MDNWNFTGKPDIPAWPKDAQGQDEKAVLLTQTFDSPADTDMIISLLAAYGIPCFKYYDLDGGAGKSSTAFPATAPACMCPKRSWRRQRICWPPGRWRTRKRKNTPERSF